MIPLVSSRARDEHGAVALMVAVLALVVFGLAALVVDLGHARDTRRQAQNAADAAALAAGNELYISGITPRIDDAVAAAKSYAATNFGITDAQWASCTDPDKLTYVPAASTECISFDESTKPTKVRVRIPVTEVNTPFGQIFGTNKVDVASRARASLEPDAKSPCALCIIGSSAHDLQNGDAVAAGGDIAFNGSVSVSSNGLVATDGNILVQNTASGPLSNYSPDPLTGQPPIGDPLDFLTLPPDMSTLSVKSDPCTDGPGKYGSFSFSNSTCTLAPGLYVIAGSSAEWKLTGNASQILTGSGVTLYFTCGTPSAPIPCAAPGSAGATMDASGNGQVSIKAPTSGPLKGLVFVMDRNNTSTFRLTGNGASGMSGTIYMPKGRLQMNGNGCSTIDSLIVTGDLEMNGNPACLNSKYLPGGNVEFPPNGLHLSQ